MSWHQRNQKRVLSHAFLVKRNYLKAIGLESDLSMPTMLIISMLVDMASLQWQGKSDAVADHGKFWDNRLRPGPENSISGDFLAG